jgi:signal transduction histidine kinase/ActR/RegA family two-component response regulator
MTARAYAWPAAVFVAVAAAGGGLVAQVHRAAMAERRQVASVVAARAGHAVEQQLTVALSATYALAAVVRQHGSIEDFESMGDEMLQIYRGLSSLQLAPGGVVKRVLPLSGNESALGHDLLADPERRADALAAIESRQLTLAGPFPLRQGGVGLVGRYPVFVGSPEGGEHFWGFTSAVIRLSALLEASRLSALAEEGYAYALSRSGPGGVVPGPFARSTGPAPRDPVQFPIRVPNGEWTLSLAPAAGWSNTGRVWSAYALAALVGLAFAWLAGRLARQPERLRAQVASRTDELARTYRLLEEDAEKRRRAEEQLRQAQKMDAIGQLAGGVAHDFNNLLTGILACAQEIQAEAPAQGPLRQAGQTIEQAATRGAQLTRQLLGFARRGKFRTAPVDLHTVVTEVVSLLSRTLDKRIAIAERLDAERAVVVGDSGQLQQAILNLAVNARDAMPEGGTLTVASNLATLGAEALRSHPGAVPGPFLALSVADTGVGIPPHNLDRIFEPFFTTKPPGQGTGMGLATVYGIASNHGGWVSVESAVGKGARFTLHLPAASRNLAVRLTPRPAPPPGSGRVLVVDDEAAAREGAKLLLQRLGYQVTLAPGGAEAVRWFEEHAREVAVVLLDLSMPGLDGRATYQALRAIDPAVRVVLSTGYGRDGRAQELLDLGVQEFVEKPFRLDQLGEALARARQGPAPLAS